MSRQRFIYPDIWRSEQFLALSIPARLLFIGIFSTSDDFGRRRASEISLKVEVFPIDAVTADQVLEMRDEISAQGLIRIYVDTEGAEILDIPSWKKFQRPKHISPSRLADYPGEGALKTDKVAKPGHIGPAPAGSEPGPGPDRASGVVWSGVVKSGSTSSPSSSDPATRDVLDGVHEVTAGKIFGWMKRHDNFRSWGKLCDKVTKVDKLNPIILLSHIFDIEASKRIKNRPAALLARLTKARSPGAKRRIPADKWHAKAKELINGVPTKRQRKKREKSKPEGLGEILKG